MLSIQITTLLAFIVTTQAQDYSGICINKADWLGDHSFSQCIDDKNMVRGGDDFSQSLCTGGYCDDAPAGANLRLQSDCTGGVCYGGTGDRNGNAPAANEAACTGGAGGSWSAATWTTLTWTTKTCAAAGQELAASSGLNFATATCSDLNYQQQFVNDVKKMASFGCCGAAQKSTCWVDFSHVCLDSANYVGLFKPSAIANGAHTCDYLMGHYTTTGQTLDGLDFSQTFDCSSSSSSDAVKDNINQIGAYGCCSGNSGAPKSTCWTAPREYIFLPLYNYYFLPIY